MRRAAVVCAAVVAALLLALVAPRGDAAAQPAQLAKRCAKGFVKSKGKCVCPKGKVKKGGKCVARSAPGTTPGTTGGGTAGGTTPGTTGGGAAADPNGPPFNPPATSLVGNDAWARVQNYLLNATFTDCVAGFPNCVGLLEHRYGFHANGTMNYCRLQRSSGGDIINAPQPFTITGVEQATSGEWGVSMEVQSYGNLTHYWWDVQPSGAVTGKYWGPGLDPVTQPPSEYIADLTWVRGGRDCSY